MGRGVIDISSYDRKTATAPLGVPEPVRRRVLERSWGITITGKTIRKFSHPKILGGGSSLAEHINNNARQRRAVHSCASFAKPAQLLCVELMTNDNDTALSVPVPVVRRFQKSALPPVDGRETWEKFARSQDEISIIWCPAVIGWRDYYYRQSELAKFTRRK